VQSFEDGNNVNAYIFDQALAIIAFTEANQVAEAHAILDVMTGLQLGEPNGAWYECYDPCDASLLDDSCEKYVTGPIAWMVIAINFYEDKTGDASYAPVARRALGWLGTMQYLTPGEDRYGSLPWSNLHPNTISTEHNLDAYSAYHWRGILDSNDSHLETASLILGFLQREMWAPSPDSNHWHDIYVFWRGLEWRPNFATDPQSWGVLALGPIGPDGESFYRSLCWLLRLGYSTRNLQDYNDTIKEVDGYRGWTGQLEFVEVDFTEHVAAAFYSIGDTNNGDHFHNQMGRIVDANGGLVHSFCDHCPNDVEWDPTETFMNYRHNYVASAAWYYFNEVKINPFVLPSAQRWARAANLDKELNVNFPDFQILASDWMDTGPALAGDIDGSGVVDYNDLAILGEFWLCGCSEKASHYL
jgi:hypothetical protein